jgi:hypothetical protein
MKGENWQADCSAEGMAIEDLKSEPMMAHLIATLESGNSIGHYGRLTFVMVARHFLAADEVPGYLQKDPECDERQARSLLDQVESRDYNPPKRERILEWMRKQEFPVCPNPHDPGQCNVYRNLDLPQDVYEKIEAFHAGRSQAQRG